MNYGTIIKNGIIYGGAGSDGASAPDLGLSIVDGKICVSYEDNNGPFDQGENRFDNIDL